ncbi:response regulator transcription factor [Chelativorans intermedius]|uniref:Response regulator n=1 Tax=Chelativorans intermedius TaxID=515947 RepID=A0ABV6D672_9HYPH|nr:response regulator transcription factor [Chelativorans intermedius]MCT8999386.1 response regulator transcription factor [Chelativorans intermedius]
MSELAPRGDIVLVVDDSPEALGFLTRALEEAGVTVLVSTSGEAALSVVEKLVPDVVLMDAVMPGLDGFETCRRLKASARLAHVPVIFMTALTETEHVVHALESGGVDYLTKPIDLEELAARMRVHLANARRAQSARVALDAAGRHLMAFSASGAVHWATPQASRLLDAAGAGENLRALLGKRVREWLAARDVASIAGGEVMLQPDGQEELQLVCLGIIGPDEHLFRLVARGERNQEETLRQHFGLTLRESEVLLWIARGKSNRDIAEVLGLSPRTVNKHLEQIYIKLGVENRASAAVKAMHVLA